MADDIHAGAVTRARWGPQRGRLIANLKQVHLLEADRLRTLYRQGFACTPGSLGENVGLENIDLTALPQGAQLYIGPNAILTLTGLRTPCIKLDRFAKGLRKACFSRDGHGDLQPDIGVMAIVTATGMLEAGQTVVVRQPAGQWRALQPI